MPPPPLKKHYLDVCLAFSDSRHRRDKNNNKPYSIETIVFTDGGQQSSIQFAQYDRKKSLKIPKGQSESVYRRRTNNTMANRKSTKGQITIYKTYK